MRILKRLTFLFLVAAILIALFYQLYMRPRYVVPILMYHAVSSDKDDSLHVSPSNFSKQIDFLRNSGYSVISMNELVQGIRNGEPCPERTVAITFDDGFEDNFLYAFPVLAKYDMPAAIFVITGYVGKKEGYLNWDQVRLMLNNGIDIGAHTRNNEYLPSLQDPERLWDEISGSKTVLEEETGKDIMFFCYPIGGFNEEVKSMVKKAGYKAACTTNRGTDRYNRDIYELNRVKITNSDCTKPLHFRAKISGYYNLFRGLKKSG
ncbi:MAG: polysaccharide deacetylase family protein [Candidatus Omnitrophota bacterium]